LENLQKIATSHDGSRTAITGFNASVEYVVDQLKQNHYKPSLQEFTFGFFKQLQPPQLFTLAPVKKQYVPGLHFGNIRFGGNGNITGNLKYANGGCLDTDFAKFNESQANIALLIRGFLKDCTMEKKISNAIKFHAKGVIMMNDPDKEGIFGSGLPDHLVAIPAFAIPYVMGQMFLEVLQSNTTVTLGMFALNDAPPVVTMNILAETEFGNPDAVIVVGSHLDGVLAGPGINDNGSGSSVNLELAIQLAKMKLKTENKILFAWWAAEEFGLLGSKYYVQEMNNTGELSKIALNLNFDMLGSPNFRRGVYNGSSGDEDIRVGSTKIQNIFESYMNENKLFYDMKEFNGRSDYGPFIEAGIPAGGLDTGAEEIKSDTQRIEYGGLANTAFDPCYHLVCDSLENVSTDVILQMAKAAANAVQTLATQKDLKQYLQNP